MQDAFPQEFLTLMWESSLERPDMAVVKQIHGLVVKALIQLPDIMTSTLMTCDAVKSAMDDDEKRPKVLAFLEVFSQSADGTKALAYEESVKDCIGFIWDVMLHPSLNHQPPEFLQALFASVLRGSKKDFAYLVPYREEYAHRCLQLVDAKRG